MDCYIRLRSGQSSCERVWGYQPAVAPFWGPGCKWFSNGVRDLYL